MEKDNNENYIIAEINITKEVINKTIRLINSFEEVKRSKGIYDIKKEDYNKYENEEEIQNNCEILIDNNKIEFSYLYKFEKEGKYLIKYIFNNNLSKTDYMFYECSSLTNIDLSNFNTQNVTNMGDMFNGCSSLTNIDLSNFNTQNVTNMCRMFYDCSSLTNIDLSNFNTQNVTDMCYMLSGCSSLKKENIIIKDNKIIKNFKKI